MCRVLNRAEWLDDPRFADAESRAANHDALDALIADATRDRRADALQSELQAAGVPAGAVLDGKDLLFNDHLNARGFYEVVEHHDGTGMPPLPYAGRPWKFAATPGEITRAAPTLGQHNESSLSDLLGYDAARVSALEEAGVIGTAPVRRTAARQPTNETLLAQGRIARWEEGFEERVRGGF